MLILGVDAHKRSHTIVAVDENGKQIANVTIGTTSAAHLDALRWADKHSLQRLWAIEDCRHLTRRLERDLLAAGEQIVRVPPKMMANVRDSARTFGKSDPIDALAAPGPLFASPGYRSPGLTGQTVSFGSSRINARPLSQNARGRSDAFAGGCTSSIQRSTPRRDR